MYLKRLPSELSWSISALDRLRGLGHIKTIITDIAESYISNRQESYFIHLAKDLNNVPELKPAITRNIYNRAFLMIEDQAQYMLDNHYYSNFAKLLNSLKGIPEFRYLITPQMIEQAVDGSLRIKGYDRYSFEGFVKLVDAVRDFGGLEGIITPELIKLPAQELLDGNRYGDFKKVVDAAGRIFSLDVTATYNAQAEIDRVKIDFLPASKSGPDFGEVSTRLIELFNIRNKKANRAELSLKISAAIHNYREPK